MYAYTQADEALFGEDAHAHGSHTAATAAGNYLEVEYKGIPVTISGIAPHANIIAFDVCGPGGCPNSYSVAAVQQAVIDGVDVLNYSIGPTSPVNPYDNAVELAMLEAISAGILTSTSAGNDGPEPSTVYKAPAWNLNVANVTHGRIFGFPVSIHEPGGAVLYDAVALPGTGKDFSSLSNKPIRWAGNDSPANVEGCSAFSADFFDGSIALISRGTCSFADKLTNALAAKAVGLLVYNNSGGPPIIMGGLEGTTIPSAMLDKEDGEAIVALMSTTLEIDISAVQVRGVKAIWGDVVAQGSSRGPYQLLDILAPDVGAPGTNVLAAYNTIGATPPFGGVGTKTEIDLMSGTSMASPHGAGSALLLMDMFPDWSPIEIKSALMMSAYNDTSLKDDGLTSADPFDIGNGRIDLTKAALIGLVMDETVANFEAANPAEGGDVKTLNVPSYQNSQCVGNCSFTRTVKNVADVDSDYDVVVSAPLGVEVLVTPTAFTLSPGGTQEVQIDIDVTGAELGDWQFAWVTFETEDTFLTGEVITNARFPLAIYPDAGNLPSLIKKNVYRDAGGVQVKDLYSIEITEMTIETAGLTEAELFEFELAGDTDIAKDPYDTLEDVWYTTFTIPSGTKRVVMEILETSASDLDLFFGYGPIPSSATEWDSSATGASLEYLSWTDPIAYDWWVLVQNWGGDETLDEVTLALALVPDVETTNYDIAAPSSVPALTEFDLELTWDIPEMEALSAWYGWFSIGSDADHPGNISETDLNVYRPYDDVIKEVDREMTENGNVVTYTIMIEPNRSGSDLDYVIHDILPDGVTYVDGSLETNGSFDLAVYDEVENAIHWEGTMPKIELTYVVSTPETNPTFCDTPFGGGYLDLKLLGVNPSPGLSGDTIYWSYAGLGANQEYFGKTITSNPTFTDDGYFYMGSLTDWWMWVPQEFPDPAVPNGIVAPWMYDMEIVYEAGKKGVSAASWGSGVLWAIQFDDIIEWDNPDAVMDFQVWSWREIDPAEGWPDLVFAFDNVSADWMPYGSIGLENFEGTVGTSFTFMDYIPASGDVICFDYTEAGANPVVIIFDAVVETDVETLITNTVLHEADGFGMREEASSALFTNYPNVKPIGDPQTLTTEEETPLDITLTGSWLEPGPVTYRIDTDPTYGTLTGTAPELVYSPFDDFYGEDSFTFIVNDGLEDSDPAMVTIEVTNINDSPIAVDDYYEVNQDGVLVVPAPGVMANDFDADPTDNTFVDLKEGTAHGMLELNEDGSFTYTPDPGFFGKDQFSYYFLGIPERQQYVDEATVHITVHPFMKIFMPIFQ